jgi:hypothetical protein
MIYKMNAVWHVSLPTSPLFAHLMTLGDPSTPHGDSSHVNISYIDSSYVNNTNCENVSHITHASTVPSTTSLVGVQPPTWPMLWGPATGGPSMPWGPPSCGF